MVMFVEMVFVTLATKWNATWNHLDKTLAQNVVDHLFIFLNENGTCRVDKCSLDTQRVDGSQHQLFLDFRAQRNVVSTFLVFRRRITGDDTETSTGSIQEDTVKSGHDFGELETVTIGNDGV